MGNHYRRYNNNYHHNKRKIPNVQIRNFKRNVIDSIFRCVPVDNWYNSGFSYMVVYDDNRCRVGIDAIRLLSKIDYPSYPLEEFDSLDDALRKYRILAVEPMNRKE